MALALRLRRALVAASTASPLLRPSASVARSLPLAPPSVSPAAPPPRAPWRFLPGGASGFRSTAAAAARGGADYGADDSKISPDEILFEGCDYNHWLITMDFPDPKPSREEMIETYLKTLAKVVGRYVANRVPCSIWISRRNAWLCFRLGLASRFCSLVLI